MTLRYGQRSVGQPVLVSSPISDPRPDFCYNCRFIHVRLSDERSGLSRWSSLYLPRVGIHKKKTPPPTALLLLRVYSLPSNGSLVWWRKSVFTVPLPTWLCHSICFFSTVPKKYRHCSGPFPHPMSLTKYCRRTSLPIQSADRRRWWLHNRHWQP